MSSTKSVERKRCLAMAQNVFDRFVNLRPYPGVPADYLDFPVCFATAEVPADRQKAVYRIDFSSFASADELFDALKVLPGAQVLEPPQVVVLTGSLK